MNAVWVLVGLISSQAGTILVFHGDDWNESHDESDESRSMEKSELPRFLSIS